MSLVQILLRVAKGTVKVDLNYLFESSKMAGGIHKGKDKSLGSEAVDLIDSV